MRKTHILPLTLGLCLAGCDGEGTIGDPTAPVTVSDSCDDDAPELVRPEGWQIDSHCKGVDPDYDLLFDDSVVRRLDIEVPPADYEATMADLEQLFGGGGGPGGGSDQEPMWVPVTVRYEGRVWEQVGMRYKGNSSLRSAYQSGGRKLPFRLGFDHYEDEHPELLDQRFWGFKKMTFSSGYKDASLMRDKVAADIFRAAGVPAAMGAFVAVFLDAGDGPLYAGLYTMIEAPSNKMLERWFDDDSGNLYKPDGPGATLSSFDQGSMVKKTNEAAADYTDMQALIAALHADRSDAEAWRQGLEAVFDVDRFLVLLSCNQAMVNWDSYGWMPHNYYLYSDPSDGGRVTWLPWDLNEAMLAPGSGGPGGASTADSVMLDEIGIQWPMIRYLLDDPVYRSRYQDGLESALQGPFEAEGLEDKMAAYHAMLTPWVVGSGGEEWPYTNLSSASAFEQSLTGAAGLFDHIDGRHEAVEDALGR